jgi:hypothetical protein
LRTGTIRSGSVRESSASACGGVASPIHTSIASPETPDTSSWFWRA